MMAPFYKFGAFGDEVSLIVAFVIGIGFGFVLERAGFGSARKLAAQFYFRDMAVLKVMFTAIVTAMVGVYLLARSGYLDLSLVYLTPTYLVPQIVGGIILGVGFVIGGYCPGTSVVSAGTGRVDGMVYLVGVVGGLLAYAEIYPMIAEWTQSTDLGQITLPAFFDLSYGLVVAAVVVMAVIAFVASEMAERRLGGVELSGGSLIGHPWKMTPARGLMAGLLGLAFVAFFAGDPYRGSRAVLDTKQLAMTVSGRQDHFTVDDLADRIIRGENNYVLLDLRDAESFNRYHIPTARNLPLSEWEPDLLPRNESIVLYSDGGIHAAQAWFLMRAQGYPSVYILLGGLDAWMEEVLYPTEPADPSPEAAREFARRAEMSRYFGGTPRTASGESGESGGPTLPELAPPVMPVAPAGAVQPAKRKKREGC
ncbi:MAG: YeeE/YedE thiosulfate transporter family protein [Opitutaceae bacterium]